MFIFLIFLISYKFQKKQVPIFSGKIKIGHVQKRFDQERLENKKNFFTVTNYYNKKTKTRA